MRKRFGDILLDPERHLLERAGAPVHVEPQVFALIDLLAGAAPELVTYDRLIEQVWGGRIVSDATLAARISAARSAVGDDGKRQSVIRTVSRRGVQLVLPVTVGPDAAPLAAPSTAPLTDTSRQTIRYSTSRDGAGIAWAETGEGPPLLRGGHWLGHLEHDWVSPVWRPLLDRLARGRRLVRYDPRGTGLSERGFGDGVTVETLADDLEAVADAAGLERFPIYAISQSVPVALTFAARRPERVSRLILLNGSVQGSTARGDAAATETMVAMIRSGWGVHGSAFMKAVATLFMPSATPEEVESIVEMQALSATAEVAARIRQVIGEIDVTEVLPRVTAPALIMHCSGDVIQSPDQSKFLARSLANAEFHLCDSPNHIVAPSDPIWAGCLDKVDRFLDGDDLA